MSRLSSRHSLPARGVDAPGRPNPGAVALVVIACALLAPVTGMAQGPARRLTTIDAVHAFAGYFHLQDVVLRGEFVERDARLVLRADGHDLLLLNPDRATKGPVEVRGQIIDVGRLDRDDWRLRTYVERRGDVEWPRPGAELLLNIAAVTEAQPATAPSVRAIALEPWKFEGTTVTLLGNFRGRNLFGDLPAAPGSSRHDFVLGAAQGAVWVTGRRPEGDGFDLDVERRVDSNKWLDVTGVVTRCGALVCIEASRMALAEAPQVDTVPELEPAAALVEIPPPPPAQVVFSIPTPDQLDVRPSAPVRIQFSKGLRETTIAGRVRASYAGAGQSDAPPTFKTTYDIATRAIQITFDMPLEPFSTVVIETLEGLTAFDGAPVLPYRLTFSVGNR